MLGIGVMLGELGGNEETVKAYQKAVGKTIKEVRLVNDELRFSFDDGTAIHMFDNGQSCCESRYMQTDDDLTYFSGTKFLGARILNAPNEPDEYGEHEVQFLEVKTDKGCFTMASHNEHNGYYGGFWIVIREVK